MLLKTSSEKAVKVVLSSVTGDVSLAVAPGLVIRNSPYSDQRDDSRDEA
ncbi:MULTISPECIES: hypothetical protein [Streptomyces]|nr:MULTISPECIES: hypothetical protein [Streptomyces]UFQ20520.1 hypothetical protein J2N69_28775 [Streptomyces huasconensis]WCL90123.1 hypothetical protein PPN52_28765 [Streptomyces sp. JCM 35825]